ncbi:hypothetical protein JCM19232_1373 [Vibrio ishigakensis]|uniref:Uncharacterized protein n=1 Tax=Vibrio ishigakensis TaxID=1481914 RepID=A0A0B8PA14_9VIBR|nr:hypothetical protein JCM19232_1373 [Vibrio ishigakensis]GAM73907.1 hypothetical protein JCM19241_5103 [Vibrio ishigakensis]
MRKRCLEQIALAVQSIDSGELWYTRKDLSKLAKAISPMNLTHI